MSHSPDSSRAPDLAVLHVTSLQESLFDGLRAAAAGENMHFVIQSREPEPYAGLEWLLPTAAFIYIGKSYFDGMLKEMGKEHYVLLKAGLKTLWAKLLGPAAPKMTVVSTEGKTSTNQPYSLVYSIIADAAEGHKFKLLFPQDITEEEYEKTVTAFLDFLRRFHQRCLDQAEVERLKDTRAVGRTMLLVYDGELNALRPLDPLPRGKSET